MSGSTCRPSASRRGKPFKPDARTAALLSDAAHTAGAMARSLSFASRERDTYYYDDRKWQFVGDVPYDFVKGRHRPGRPSRLCLLHGVGATRRP
ncbi:MAG: hypothetical protein WDM81_02430 [Rhizomicrobium sp.]